MGLLDSQTQKILVESMRHSLTESVQKNQKLTESAQATTVKFVNESATYEQLLNLTLNPLFESKYLPTHVLEGAFAIASEAMLTGRKVIGPNAIAEGAKNLIKKTDCVITESMLDAADALVQSKGLNVVANTITEAFSFGGVLKGLGKALNKAGKSSAVKKADKAVAKGAKKVTKATKAVANKVAEKTAPARKAVTNAATATKNAAVKAATKAKNVAKNIKAKADTVVAKAQAAKAAADAEKAKKVAKKAKEANRIAKLRAKEMPDTSMKTNADASKKTAMDWLKKKLGK